MTEIATYGATSVFWGGKEMNIQHPNAIVAEALSLDLEDFSAWRGGWVNDIELALLDAVLSIQAQSTLTISAASHAWDLRTCLRRSMDHLGIWWPSHLRGP